MKNPRCRWPFGGRTAELDLIRENLRGNRCGIAVSGGAGAGRSRLAAEAAAGLRVPLEQEQSRSQQPVIDQEQRLRRPPEGGFRAPRNRE